MKKAELVQSGFVALLLCCKAVEVSYTIRGGYKLWRNNMKWCTVTVGNKQFTNRGEDCETVSIKEAVFYLIDTYSALSQFKEAKDKDALDIEQTILGLA